MIRSMGSGPIHSVFCRRPGDPGEPCVVGFGVLICARNWIRGRGLVIWGKFGFFLPFVKRLIELIQQFNIPE